MAGTRKIAAILVADIVGYSSYAVAAPRVNSGPLPGRGDPDESPFPSRTTAVSHRVIVQTKARHKGRDASCKNPQSQSS
jgi:hypothetical protein